MNDLHGVPDIWHADAHMAQGSNIAYVHGKDS